MDLVAFKKSLSANEPPTRMTVYLKAMWYDAKGNWDKAHKLIQDEQDKTAAWIHAYLHRKEGDVANGDYWYAKAGKKRASVSLNQEWEEIIIELL